jgi:hypothetical protein
MRHLVPWGANDFAMKISISKWKTICLELIETLENHLREMIRKLSKDMSAKFGTPKFASDLTYVPVNRSN